MYKFLFSILVLLGMATTAHSVTIQTAPDTTLNLVDKSVITAKMVDAKNKQFAGDFRGAMNIYREVIATDKSNAMAHFRLAECHYEVNNWDLSKEYLDKSVALDAKVSPEVDYLYGKIFHRTEKIDEAIAKFEAFKASLKPELVKNFDTEYYLSQLRSAKEMMAKPLQVTIKNGGPHLNSKFDDYSPVISPDGKTIYFTTRRPQGTGGLKAGDDVYFEDIFFTTLNEEGNWSDAEQVEGKLNTDEFDNCSHLSAGGTTMYITQNISRYTKSSDIAVAKMAKSGKWNMAKLMPKGVNSSFFDACPSLTPDEKTMYFVSERNGEKFGSDIFKTTKSGSKWSAPIPVTSLNSEENETTVWIHPNMKWMFFSSKGHNSMGGYDIFVAEWTGTDWGAPRNLGYPINSVNDDTHFRISPDGKYALFASQRPGGVGGRDIYMVDISSLDWLK